MRRLLFAFLLTAAACSAAVNPSWVNLADAPMEDIRAYGAVPNDGLDDSSAIQAALATGKVAFVPEGIFNCSSTIVLQRYQSLVGADWATSIIESGASGAAAIQTATGSSPTPNSGSTVDGVTIANLMVRSRLPNNIVFNLGTSRYGVFRNLQADMSSTLTASPATGMIGFNLSNALTNASGAYTTGCYYNTFERCEAYAVGIATTTSSIGWNLGRQAGGWGANANGFIDCQAFGCAAGWYLTDTSGCWGRMNARLCTYGVQLNGVCTGNQISAYIEACNNSGLIHAGSSDNQIFAYVDQLSAGTQAFVASSTNNLIFTNQGDPSQPAPGILTDSFGIQGFVEKQKIGTLELSEGFGGLVSLSTSGTTSAAGGGAGTALFSILKINGTAATVATITQNVTGAVVALYATPSATLGNVDVYVLAPPALSSSYEVSVMVNYFASRNTVPIKQQIRWVRGS